LGGPLECRNKTCFGKSKRIYQNLFYHRVLQCCWGCLYSKPLFKSFCSTPTPTLSQHCPNNSIKNEIYVPPRRFVLPSSPHLLSVPTCHSLPRRLLPLWIQQFRQICPLLLRSQAESEVAYFTCTSFGGHGTLPFAANSVNVDARRETGCSSARGSRRTGERGRHGWCQ
jgi:hypothetical protein